MKARFVIICVWLLTLGCVHGGVVTARSFSGQFTARELRYANPVVEPMSSQQIPVAGGWAFLLNNPPAANHSQEEVTLEPSLLVLSCERLKDGLLGDLGLADRWRAQINLVIRPDWKQDRQPVLTANHDAHGWSYVLEFPKYLRRQVLIRAMMESVLLEMANRSADGQSVQIPFWLVEGMTAHLEAYSPDGFVLQRSLENGKVRLQGMDLVRDELRHHEPVSFQRLSWPQESDETGEGLQLYRSCAHLFVEDLLQFKDGRDCLVSMISLLPKHLNWQTAFLLGFQPHFHQFLDVEKWWSLSYVEFVRLDPGHPWTSQDCWKKLQAALDVPVQVHFSSNAMPAEAVLTLQEAIAQWPDSEVKSALRRTVGDLEMLHYRAEAPLRELVDLYLQTLIFYGNGSGSKRNAITQLDALDKRRYAWQPIASAR